MDYKKILKRKIYFDDDYEIDKVIAIINTKNEKSKNLLKITKIIDNEAIICLHDNSYHSVTMKSNTDAIELNNIIKDITVENKKIMRIERDEKNLTIFTGDK